ncbi:sigma-70 family RNA polymerase sigma factor [Streptomyces sp. Tu6071]|uniref:sigma-70 family RNA polymerase sigma factor n=1 Tax=Streptomyces sp. Tu6071 TaxID=355249 RepID=UPI000311661E|nr:sigma-70 family RNA polymerase sigma factor [Streptomyces sp. Tu6071]
MSTPAPRSGRRPAPIRCATEDLVPPPLEEPSSLEDYDFEAFYLSQQEFFHAYAELQLGTRAAAEELVHETFLKIQDSWEQIATEGKAEQQALLLLHAEVKWRLHIEGRDPSFVRNGPVRQHNLAAIREQLELHDSPRGLYAAIAALNDRQFDAVLVLWLIAAP